MYLLYLDDSGSENNADETYFVLGGVSVFERQVYWLSDSLDSIATDLCPTNPQSVEFHASECWAGRDEPWKSMTNKDDRKAVLRRVLNVAATAHHSVRLFACAVHKASFPGENPVAIAFEELVNRFDLQLRRNRQDEQRGLLILDDSAHETALQSLALEFKVSGTRWRDVKTIAEVPLFVSSAASRCIQLADHVAYAVRRRFEVGDTSYLDQIMHRFDSADGSLHGFVHKHKTLSSCMCQSCMLRTLQKSGEQKRLFLPDVVTP